MHLNLEACLAVCRGEMSPALLLRSLHEHLIEECPDCRREWLAAVEQTGVTELFPLRSATDRAGIRPLPADPRLISLADVEAREALLSRLLLERRDARKDLAKLLGGTPYERRRRIARSKTRFRSPALAEMLIDESRNRAPSDPAEAADLAALVPVVMDRVPEDRRAAWEADLPILYELAETQRRKALRHVTDPDSAGEITSTHPAPSDPPARG